MALPSSGQISLNDVRIETSQSITNNYSLTNALNGYGNWNDPKVYAPINVLGLSGTMGIGGDWSEDSPIGVTNYSMSIWYGYDHNVSIDTYFTGTLYPHSAQDCYSKTMLIVNVGTENKELLLNISGSISIWGWEVYYGKPWKNDGSQYTSSMSTFITGAGYNGETPLNESINYSYTYDSNKGQYLYFIISTFCP
jgi:hypothetical protein